MNKQLAVEVFPRGSKSFPKKEPVGDPEKSENKRVPKKKKKFSSKEEPPSRGSEEAALQIAAVSIAAVSRKKRKLQKLSQET